MVYCDALWPQHAFVEETTNVPRDPLTSANMVWRGGQHTKLCFMLHSWSQHALEGPRKHQTVCWVALKMPGPGSKGGG